VVLKSLHIEGNQGGSREIMAEELENILTVIGLEQYLETFKSAGFYDWPALCTITESELAALNVLRGHRRRLQREIARRSGYADQKPLPSHH
jgi:hypothetical protein